MGESWVLKALLQLIRLYQATLSRLIPGRCRFFPTCSEYAIASLLTYGLKRGSYLSLRRILRCHPFHPGGFDPLPRDKSQ